MNRLDHALTLARQGFLIFPLRAGSKEPFSKAEMGGRGWKEYMTSDESVIRHWFTVDPEINYAVTFGDRGFILDPDVDASTGKNGLVVLDELEAENFEEPITGQTFTVRSPRGGQHLYFLSPYPVGNSRGAFPVGIDVRGRGGYVVGPASHTVSDPEHNTAEGTYEVIVDVAPMEAPRWVLDKLERAGVHNDNTQDAIYELDQPHAIEQVRGLIQQQTSWPTEGQGGDQATYSFIALARGWAVSAEKMLELLLEPYGDDELSWNDRCDPPWEVGDLERKIENAYTYATSAPGVKGGLLDSMEEAGQEYLTEAPFDEAEKLTKASGLDSIYFPGGSLLARAEQREMIIPEYLMAHGMTALLAKRGAGKTVTMIDMALRLACDMDWQKVPMAQGWCAVYACGEDDLGLQEQMRAWTQINNTIPADDRFIVMTATPNLLKPDEVEAWTRYLLAKLNGRRAIFFVDTWQRATSHASQNDDDDMQTAIAHVEAISKSLRGPSVIAFHPPKANDTTLMGSSTIENSSVAIWRLSKEANHRRLEVTRIKGKGEGNYRLFTFEIIKLGEQDQFGQDRTGVVAVARGGTGEAESEALKSMNATARYYYASLIRNLFVEYNDSEREVDNKSAFNITDTADRICKHFANHPDDPYLPKLRALQESYWSSDRSMRRRLEQLFIQDTNPQITDNEVDVVSIVAGKGNGKKFVVT